STSARLARRFSANSASRGLILLDISGIDRTNRRRGEDDLVWAGRRARQAKSSGPKGCGGGRLPSAASFPYPNLTAGCLALPIGAPRPARRTGMPYVARNDQGQIIEIAERKTRSAREQVALDDPDLVAYLAGGAGGNGTTANIRAALEASDLEFIRVIED